MRAAQDWHQTLLQQLTALISSHACGIRGTVSANALSCVCMNAAALSSQPETARSRQHRPISVLSFCTCIISKFLTSPLLGLLLGLCKESLRELTESMAMTAGHSQFQQPIVKHAPATASSMSGLSIMSLTNSKLVPLSLWCQGLPCTCACKYLLAAFSSAASPLADASRGSTPAAPNVSDRLYLSLDPEIRWHYLRPTLPAAASGGGTSLLTSFAMGESGRSSLLVEGLGVGSSLPEPLNVLKRAIAAAALLSICARAPCCKQQREVAAFCHKQAQSYWTEITCSPVVLGDSILSLVVGFMADSGTVKAFLLSAKAFLLSACCCACVNAAGM